MAPPQIRPLSPIHRTNFLQLCSWTSRYWANAHSVPTSCPTQVRGSKAQRLKHKRLPPKSLFFIIKYVILKRKAKEWSVSVEMVRSTPPIPLQQLKRADDNTMHKIYAKKLDNLEEMYTFLGTENFPRWNHKEIDNLNKLIGSTENKCIRKTNSQRMQVQVDRISQRNSIKHIEYG